MSWLYSRALVEEYSEATSSDGARSALSSGSPTQQAFLPHDKMTAFCRHSRSGMTFAPLTDGLGADLLTWFLADSRVRTYPLLGEGPESTASDQGCGEKWRASLAKYDPDSSSWKTAQLSLLEGSDEFSETWPNWGMTRNGECWERMMWVPRTAESVSGSWPAMIPTPSATEGGPMPELAHEPRMNQRNYSAKTGKHCQVTLRRWVETWPTPTVCGNYNRKGASKTSGDGLATAVKNWPTPQASDNRDRGNLSSGCVQRRREKGKQIGLSQSVATVGGRLNPTWVEWLMGWPQGWTDLKPLATDKFREWQRQHSISSPTDSD